MVRRGARMKSKFTLAAWLWAGGLAMLILVSGAPAHADGAPVACAFAEAARRGDAPPHHASAVVNAVFETLFHKRVCEALTPAEARWADQLFETSGCALRSPLRQEYERFSALDLDADPRFERVQQRCPELLQNACDVAERLELPRALSLSARAETAYLAAFARLRSAIHQFNLQNRRALEACAAS